MAAQPDQTAVETPPPEAPPGADDAQVFFDVAAGDYDDQHYGTGVRSFMSVRLEGFLAAVDGLRLPPGSIAVEAGCGPGRLAAGLASRGLRVLAHDTSPEMLRRARKRLRALPGAAPCALQVATVERMPYRDASVDLVCSAGVLEYLSSDAAMFGEIHRVLRPGGHALLAVTNLWSPAGSLDFAVEAAKRQPWLVRAVQTLRPEHPVRPRNFPVRRHRPAVFRRRLASAGLEVVRGQYFYLLPWPHPFDRLFPHATARLNNRLEPWSSSPLGWLAEGYLAIARRPA